LFVSGGGWFPWQNQSTAIYTVCDEVARRNSGTVKIFGTPHAQNASSAEEQRIMDVYQKVMSLSEDHDRIQVCGYVGRDELLSVYAKATLALEVMEYNLERELAFTTRTIEYLWCGLPVMYNNFGEIASHIQDYDAGWCLDPSDSQAIAEAVDEIFTDAELVRQKSQNAQRLVRDRFAWDITIEPLVSFLKQPKVLKESDPVMGLVYTRPSFLQAKGRTQDFFLSADSSELCQRVVVPAENICGIELPVFLPREECRDLIDSLLLTLRVKGRVIAKRKYQADGIPTAGSVALVLPFWRAPVGGEELELLVRVKAKSQLTNGASELLGLRGLAESRFPFGALSINREKGATEDLDVQALALSFMPAEYSMAYKLKLMASRGLHMIRQGQWKRLYRAVLRRIPRVLNKFRLST
jgi:hypothetical protein